MTTLFDDLSSALRLAGQPRPLFEALDRLTGAVVGHQLFTLLVVDGDEVARVYSNRPVEYPVSGRKPMGPTPWGDRVLRQQMPFLGRTRAEIRWAFFDHVLIESMGLGSVINVPVVYNGKTLGTMNLLDVEHRYSEEHLAMMLPLVPYLIPAFLGQQGDSRDPLSS